MKFLIYALLLASVQASWFGGDKADYDSWDDTQLQQWLNAHDIAIPKGYSTKDLQELVKANWAKSTTWTSDQYEKAQKVFQGVKHDTIKDWDESKLRSVLVDQGIVNPSGPKESLVQMAKSQYASYTSFASAASASASTMMYGDKAYQASKSASSAAVVATSSINDVSAAAKTYAAQATSELTRKFDVAKDYVYSNWSESELRAYLQKKGIVAPPKSTREELMDMVKTSYDKIWEAWTDSYMHDWLVSHGIIKSEAQRKREEYVKLMKNYYYDVNERVWDSWTESELREWLLEHNIIKTDAQIKREKMIKMVKDNYNSAVDTIYAGWTDSQMRDWLVEHGYIRTETQAKRDELIKLFNDKYTDTTSKAATYLTWPDARLRAYLRNHDMEYAESMLPTSRPGLIQEVRIRWVQTTNSAEALYNRLRELVNSGVEFAEDKIGDALAILTGTADEATKQSKKAAADLVKDYKVQLAAAEKNLKSASAEAVKASKTAEAKIVKEKSQQVASASSMVSSLSAELAKASKKAKAEL